MLTFKGKVERILFEKDDYLIATFVTENGKKIKIIGEMYGISADDKMKIMGCFEEHHKFGWQFRVQEWNKVMPDTAQEIMEFLSSGFIKGVGRKRAELIIEQLGNEAVKIINEQGAAALKGIKGIGEKTAQTIAESIQENFEIHDIIEDLKQYHIPTSVILKLYKKHRSETVKKVLDNPYIMTEIRGMNFFKVDEIARKHIEIPYYSGRRVSACVGYTLNSICNRNGHSFVSETELIVQTMNNLNRFADETEHVDEMQVQQTIYSLDDEILVATNNKVYPKKYYDYELNIAKKLSIIRNNNRMGEALPKIKELIRKYQKEQGFILSEEQKIAIETMMQEKVMVLTGDAGTGKTTVVKAVLDIYKQLHKESVIRLCAPTGRASKRLQEATGKYASTIHRLIGYKNDGQPFYHNGNKLVADLVVVDEFSMADLEITHLLLDALPKETKIMFIGDADQLQSVGVGNVLHDFINSNIPVVRLTEVFRQAKESQIIFNAHRVNQGESILVNHDKGDFYFIQQENVLAIQELIVRSVKRFFELGYTLNDILVLSPMYKTDVGVDVLNERLRNEINPKSPSKKEINIGKRLFREGDKVIQNTNNADKDVYNGEIGIIKSITKEENHFGKLVDIVICEFDGKLVKYSRDEMHEIDLAYAITIHKSQGGESPVVIMPVTMQHKVMLARNLCYTAITRAKEKVVLIGDMKAMDYAIRNVKVTKRNSTLKERIINEFEVLKKMMNV